MLFRDLAVLAAALSNHGASASILRKPVHYHTGSYNETRQTSSTGGMPYWNGTRTVVGIYPSALTTSTPSLDQPMPGQGNGTATSCDVACRDDFKNRTLLMNAASAATYVLDQMDLWEECWEEPTCQNAVALVVGDTATSLKDTDQNSTTLWDGQRYGDFIITMGNKAALDAMSGTYSILKTLVAGVNEPDYLSHSERKLLWDIGQLSSFVAAGPTLDEEAFAQAMRETTVDDNLMPDWMAAPSTHPSQTSQGHPSDIQVRSADDEEDDNDGKKLAPLAALAIIPPALGLGMHYGGHKFWWKMKKEFRVRIGKPFGHSGGGFIRKLNTAYNTNMVRGDFRHGWHKRRRKPQWKERGKPPNDFTRRTQRSVSTEPPKMEDDLSRWRPKPNRPEVSNVWPWEHPNIPEMTTCYDGTGAGALVVKRAGAECLPEPWQEADAAIKGGMDAVNSAAPVAAGVIGAAAAAGKVMFDALDPVGGFLDFYGLGGGHHGGDDEGNDDGDDHEGKPTHHPKPEPTPEPTHEPTSIRDEDHSTTSSSERHSTPTTTTHGSKSTPAQSQRTPASTASPTLHSTTSRPISHSTSGAISAPSSPPSTSSRSTNSSTLNTTSSTQITSRASSKLLSTASLSTSTATLTTSSSTLRSVPTPVACLGNMGIMTTLPISLVPFGSPIPTGGVAIGSFSSQYLVAPSSAFPSTFDMAALTGTLQPFGMVPTGTGEV